MTVDSESADDYPAIDHVHRLAFRQEGEGRLVRALREQGYTEPNLSLVGRVGSEVVAHVLFSKLTIQHDAGSLKALALAPVAVLPGFQRQGIGTELIRVGIKRAEHSGYPAILVLGDPAFYARFGFSLKLGALVQSAYSGPHFMALEFQAATLSSLRQARVQYPEPFSVV